MDARFKDVTQSLQIACEKTIAYCLGDKIGRGKTSCVYNLSSKDVVVLK